MDDYDAWADDNAAALADTGLEEMPDPDEWDGLTDLEAQLEWLEQRAHDER